MRTRPENVRSSTQVRVFKYWHYKLRVTSHFPGLYLTPLIYPHTHTTKYSTGTENIPYRISHNYAMHGDYIHSFE